ncbi:hypothetical protein D3C71_1940460 [compost metagenome]
MARRTHKMRILHAVADMRIAGQIAQISQKRMAAVEHPQLHLFVGQHVADQFGTGLFPCRTSLRKVIFDHPLAEGLTGDGNRIGDATE